MSSDPRPASPGTTVPSRNQRSEGTSSWTSLEARYLTTSLFPQAATQTESKLPKCPCLPRTSTEPWIPVSTSRSRSTQAGPVKGNLHSDSLRRFPHYDFRYYLTLSSECFASFPRGTCMLSDSHPVLSLRRSVPPTLGCTLKQPDSKLRRFTKPGEVTGL
jgi:hypothetical protein